MPFQSSKGIMTPEEIVENERKQEELMDLLLRPEVNGHDACGKILLDEIYKLIGALPKDYVINKMIITDCKD